MPGVALDKKMVPTRGNEDMVRLRVNRKAKIPDGPEWFATMHPSCHQQMLLALRRACMLTTHRFTYLEGLKPHMTAVVDSRLDGFAEQLRRAWARMHQRIAAT